MFIRSALFWLVMFFSTCLPMQLTAQAGIGDPVEITLNTVTESMNDMLINEALYTSDSVALIKMAEERILPRFDFNVMTQLAMGKYWAGANSSQKQQMINEFRDLLVRTYTNILFVHRYDKTKVHGKDLNTQGDVTVEIEVIREGADPVSLILRMRKMANDWKAIDVLVDGISLIVNYRQDFSNEISQFGIDGLIKTLKKKNASPSNE